MIYPSVRTLANVINTNYSITIGYRENKSLFRGGWYFASLPFNLEEVPLISNYDSKEGQ
jgi:hypothetical protein